VTGEHALILPCLGRTELDVQKSGEQFVTVENSMGVVHTSRGNVKPADHHLKSEPAIVSEIADVVFGNKFNIAWKEMRDNYDLIRNEIEKVIPGFDDFNKRVRQPDGFYLPNGPRNGKFTTSSGKALFTVNPMPQFSVPKDHLVMMTIRSHDQYNTTIYGLDDRYRGIKNERRVVLMNRQDMHHFGFREKELVNIVSDQDGTSRVASHFHVIPFDIPKGSCATCTFIKCCG
jgi:anaerobic selenocysteine-containing dehydrogenase